MNDQFSTLLDECVQIFLTDTNQYLALTDSDAKIRAQFLQAFAQMPTFEHQETLISTIHHTKDIEKILDTVGQKNIAIYFLDIPTHLPF